MSVLDSKTISKILSVAFEEIGAKSFLEYAYPIVRFKVFNVYKMISKIVRKEGWENAVGRAFAFAVIRGPNLKPEAMKNYDAKTVAYVNSFKTVLDVVDKPTDETSCTLPRLIVAFAGLYAKFLATAGAMARVIGNVGDLPLYFAFPAAPSLWTEVMRKNYEADYLKWALSFDKVIKPKAMNKKTGEEMTEAERKAVIKNFYDISLNNKLYSNEEKDEMFSVYSKVTPYNLSKADEVAQGTPSEPSKVKLSLEIKS